MRDGAESPAVFTIPSHRSFADALAAGLIQRFGRDPLSLAAGRILLPNNRAVRSVTEAFVRASGSGLLLPRLIPVGDPDLGERIGGAIAPLAGDRAARPAAQPCRTDARRRHFGRRSASAGAGPCPHAGCLAGRGGRAGPT